MKSFFRMSSVIAVMLFITLATFLVACDKITISEQSFERSHTMRNQVSTYTALNGTSYIGINEISKDNHIEPLENIELPVPSLIDYEIFSTMTDGKFLYINGAYFGIDEAEKPVRKKLIYRIDVNEGEVATLVSEKLPSSGRNNNSMAVNNGYLYFFMEKEDMLNDVCCVSIDGGDVEKLTDNQDEIYTGIFFADNGKVYYSKSDLNLYEAVDGNFESGKIVRENVYTITYENGMFYCKLENGDFIMFSQDSPENEQMIDIGIYMGRYLIKNGKIYYMKYLPKVLGFDAEHNVESVNTTQGKVFVYDIVSGKDELLVENSELDVLSILDVNDEVVLVHVNTNDAILGNSYGNGEGTYWYMRIKDGNIFEIKKK